MKRLFVVALLVLMFLDSAPCAAEYFIDVNKFKEWIDAQYRLDAGRARVGDYMDAAQLFGYVEGIYDSMDMSLEIGLSSCNLKKAGQLVAIVSQYVSVHPKEWSKPTAFLVQRAILGACKKNIPK